MTRLEGPSPTCRGPVGAAVATSGTSRAGHDSAPPEGDSPGDVLPRPRSTAGRRPACPSAVSPFARRRPSGRASRPLLMDPAPLPCLYNKHASMIRAPAPLGNAHARLHQGLTAFGRRAAWAADGRTGRADGLIDDIRLIRNGIDQVGRPVDPRPADGGPARRTADDVRTPPARRTADDAHNRADGVRCPVAGRPTAISGHTVPDGSRAAVGTERARHQHGAWGVGRGAWGAPRRAKAATHRREAQGQEGRQTHGGPDRAGDTGDAHLVRLRP